MSDDDSEWRFGLDEVGPEAVEDGSDETEPGGSVAGGTERAMPVEPGSVDLESVVFVLLGVAATLFVFVRFVVG
jgi:hypothetical protein